MGCENIKLSKAPRRRTRTDVVLQSLNEIVLKTMRKVTEDTSVIDSRFVAHEATKSCGKRYARSQRTPL
eukprot:2456855-Rhodomonas_salina.1